MGERNEILGSTVIVARAARRWTQTDLASRLGITRQAVARYEAGEPPSEANLAKLREVLGPDVWKVPAAPAPRFGVADVRGVRYAALRMSETVTQLLREIAEVEDVADAIAMHDAARAATPAPAPTARKAGRKAQG